MSGLTKVSGTLRPQGDWVRAADYRGLEVRLLALVDPEMLRSPLPRADERRALREAIADLIERRPNSCSCGMYTCELHLVIAALAARDGDEAAKHTIKLHGALGQLHRYAMQEEDGAAGKARGALHVCPISGEACDQQSCGATGATCIVNVG